MNISEYVIPGAKILTNLFVFSLLPQLVFVYQTLFHLHLTVDESHTLSYLENTHQTLHPSGQTKKKIKLALISKDNALMQHDSNYLMALYLFH